MLLLSIALLSIAKYSSVCGFTIPVRPKDTSKIFSHRFQLNLTQFVPQAPLKTLTPLPSSTQRGEYAEVGGKFWDPLQLSQLGKNFDTFPGMFPDAQFLEEAEIKHGRMSMLAWTGIWATHVGGFGLGMHFPGMPVESDFTKAFGVVAHEQPGMVAAIIGFIAIAEGESVGHSGDNFRGKGRKAPGDMGLYYASRNNVDRYKIVEKKNGRAAMIAMASIFAWQSIPGSVPVMDLLSP